MGAQCLSETSPRGLRRRQCLLEIRQRSRFLPQATSKTRKPCRPLRAISRSWILRLASLPKHRRVTSTPENSLPFLWVHLPGPTSIMVWSDSLAIMLMKRRRSHRLPSLHLVNTWWIAEDIRKYLKNETPGAVVWKPWNAFIFDSITDFVSTLRAEASMPGAHFKWPEQRMTYEMVIAQAIHHLPPGYHVSIKNGNPCPKELLISTPEWHGEAAQYYHGTTTHSLLRGIIRDGLKPTFDAGGETTARAWGQNTPMVYLSKNREKSRYHNDDEFMKILANHQLGNSVAELPTQESQPEETKTDKTTASLVDSKLTESSVSKSADWKKSDWKDWSSNSYWLPQSWGTSWSSQSWQEKDNSDDKNKNSKKEKASDSAQKEALWRTKQAVCYTTHYRGILSVISSFPVDYYCTNKGNYVSLEWGQHCDPTTVYPIPTGDLLEHGESHPETLRGVKIPDENTPTDDIPDVWKAYQKQHEEDHRRCTRAAIEDQQFTAERARAEYAAWQNKIKEKSAVQLSLCDKVGKADAINHGDVELIDLSEKKDDASSSKADSPTSPAAKWHQVDSSIYKKVKTEEDTAKTVTANRGLVLTLIQTEDSLTLPEEDNISTKGYEPNEDTKNIKIEPKEQPNPDENYVLVQSAPYEQPPIMDQMPTGERIALIIDAVNHIADNTDPESHKFLQNMMKAVYDLKISQKSSSSSSSSSGYPLPTWLQHLAKHVNETSPADAVMADADSPAKIDDANKVSLSESDNDIDVDR